MKAFSTSLSNNLQKVMFPVASQLDLQLCATPVCLFVFFFWSATTLFAYLKNRLLCQWKVFCIKRVLGAQ